MDAAVELLLRRGGLFWDFGMMCAYYLLKTRPIANRIYEGRHGHYDIRTKSSKWHVLKLCTCKIPDVKVQIIRILTRFGRWGCHNFSMYILIKMHVLFLNKYVAVL